jgi:hypothetical protein
MGRHQQHKPGYAQHCNQQLSLEPHILSNPGAYVVGQRFPVQSHVDHSCCYKEQGSGVVHGHEQVAPPGGPVMRGNVEGDAGRNQPRACAEQNQRCQSSGADPSPSREFFTHLSSLPRFPQCRPNIGGTRSRLFRRTDARTRYVALSLAFGKTLSIVALTSPSHCFRSLSVLLTTTLNMRRQKVLTPHSPKTQLRQMASSGSPKMRCSRSGIVFDVLKTMAALAVSRPFGIPSPESPSKNSYAIPGRITRSIQPFNIAGGCPHQFG